VNRKLFRLALIGALAACAGAAQGQAAWPAKPVRIVVGFPPGTTGDILARIASPRMSESLGQPVLVENRPGAGSSIAAEAVAKAAPDGYTLLLSTIANAINPSLYKLGFDFSRDLAAVALLADGAGLLVAHPSAPPTMPALIAAAKADPGKLLYASSGNGTVTHLWGEMLNGSAGIKLTHVPYKGSSQAVTDLLAGNVALLFTPASTVIPHVNAGRLAALAVIGRQRLASLPGVPTMTELGVAGLESGLWFGLNAPAGTPPAVIERLNVEARRAFGLADVKAQLAAQGIEAVPGTAQAFAAFVRDETDKWARVVRASGAKAD
jgi:tripartite-type tricarboxylate transporter receptor subunit TctC